MSKKYDEYLERVSNGYYQYQSMISKRDPELDREIRDRAIIALVEYAVKNNLPYTYGEIISIVDNDTREKEYEEEKRRLSK